MKVNIRQKEGWELSFPALLSCLEMLRIEIEDDQDSEASPHHFVMESMTAPHLLGSFLLHPTGPPSFILL